MNWKKSTTTLILFLSWKAIFEFMRKRKIMCAATLIYIHTNKIYKIKDKLLKIGEIWNL